MGLFRHHTGSHARATDAQNYIRPAKSASCDLRNMEMQIRDVILKQMGKIQEL